MTWSYTLANPLSTKDQIRLLISDTDPNDTLLQDEEIYTIIAMESGSPSGDVNVWRAAGAAADAVASSFDRLGDERDGTTHVQYSQRASGYRARAVKLLGRARRSGVTPYAGGISISDKQIDEGNGDRTGPFFARTMLDAPGDSSAATVMDGSNDLVAGGLP